MKFQQAAVQCFAMGKFKLMKETGIISSSQTLLCVKQVKHEVVEEWDEAMPLPGDIIQGVADGEHKLFVPTKGKSELRSQLSKISKKIDGKGAVWLNVRRGNKMVNLRVCIVQERSSKLRRKYTIRAASNDKHVAVLADLDFDQCTELQEMSRRFVNDESRGFNQKAINYDWRTKVGTFLPDHRSTVVSSILFHPLLNEHDIDSTTVRTMAWFSAAVSSGTPLVFVNIQTEQIISLEKGGSTRQQNCHGPIEVVQGIRLWFMPGLEEIPIDLIPEPGEARFGMDIKRTEEGFVCVNSVTNGTAADRAGLCQLFEKAYETGHLLVISRLQGKSVMPSMASSDGQIHCCDHADIKATIVEAMDQLDNLSFHVMSWPIQNPPRTQISAQLRPPS